MLFIGDVFNDSKIIDKQNQTIILEKDYPDILPMLEMIKQKATVNIFLDNNGDQRVFGRFYDYDYEYTIELNSNTSKETLLVRFDIYDDYIEN